MLQATEIRLNKENSIKGLQKRGIKDAEAKINKVLELDDHRKQLKTQMDQLLAEANQLAKQIGQLMQSGK